MIKLGIIGMSEGNGHPYSWAAIINGYDREAMASCPFPVIPKYLGEEQVEHFGIEGALVTHVWTQDQAISEHIASASNIECVAIEPEFMIGEIDALLLARDDGENHLAMAAPFLDKGIPVFIDKPLADNRADLEAFRDRFAKGQKFLSSSCFRYCQELKALAGEGFTYATAFSPKYWRTYGIHMLEGVRAVMGGGLSSVRNVGSEGKAQVQLKWRDGREALIEVIEGVAGPMAFQFHKSDKWVRVDSFDSFGMFKAQLVDFVNYVQTGKPPFDMEETFELVEAVIEGRKLL